MKKAFKDIIRNNFTSVYRFFLLILADVKSAKQLTYKVFLTVYKTGSIENQKFSLYKEAHKLLESREIVNSFKIDETQLEPIGLKSDNVNKDFITKIFNNLTNLKQEYIEIAILKFVEGIKEEKIAEIIDKPQVEVSSITSEVLHYLKSKLDEGRDEDDRVSINDVSINIAKLARFKNFIPEVEYTEEVISALSKENVEFEKAIQIDETEKEKAKVEIEKIPGINWKLLIYILLAIAITIAILLVIF